MLTDVQSKSPSAAPRSTGSWTGITPRLKSSKQPSVCNANSCWHMSFLYRTSIIKSVFFFFLFLCLSITSQIGSCLFTLFLVEESICKPYYFCQWIAVIMSVISQMAHIHTHTHLLVFVTNKDIWNKLSKQEHSIVKAGLWSSANLCMECGAKGNEW